MYCAPAHSTFIINSLSDSSDFCQGIISVSLYCECLKCPSRLAKMKLLKANSSGPACSLQQDIFPSVYRIVIAAVQK